jgi:hypothetical protein
MRVTLRKEHGLIIEKRIWRTRTNEELKVLQKKTLLVAYITRRGF